MKPACLALSSALLLACTACAAGRAPEPPPDEQPALGPATWTPLPPPSNAPVDTSPPPADFWKLGQAACPEGATFSPALPPYFQAACTRDGKIDGPTATFDADGHLLLLERYDRGQAVGMHIAYFASGKQQRAQAWQAGKEHGPFTRWYEGGQKAEEGAYVEGRLDGEIKAWDAKGRGLASSTFIAGTGRYNEYHPDGKPAQQRNYLEGLEHGTRTVWHVSGVKIREQQFDHGVQHGRFAEWSDEGRPLRAGQFSNDKESGRWSFHGPDGAITRVDTYLDGEVVASITYQDGKPLGQAPADQACATAEGLARAFQASTGEPLDDGGAHCVRRAVHFPGVVAIGLFGHDRGCTGAGVMVDCQYQKEVDGARILARVGWKRARPVTREQLARDYVAEVGLVWNMSDDPSPAARLANGDIVVTGSVRVVGMHETASHSPEFRFTPEGVVTRARD